MSMTVVCSLRASPLQLYFQHHAPDQGSYKIIAIKSKAGGSASGYCDSFSVAKKTGRYKGPEIIFPLEALAACCAPREGTGEAEPGFSAAG